MLEKIVFKEQTKRRVRYSRLTKLNTETTLLITVDGITRIFCRTCTQIVTQKSILQSDRNNAMPCDFYRFRLERKSIENLPITDKLYRKLLVAEFRKSTRHRYTPSSFRRTSSTKRQAGSVIVRKTARLPNTSGAE